MIQSTLHSPKLLTVSRNYGISHGANLISANTTATMDDIKAKHAEFKKEDIDVSEVTQRLTFPVILYLVNIVVYLSSASFAWKAWKLLIDGSTTGMTPFENEDDKPGANPIE